MEQARVAGIKYFRILNKEELEIVLTPFVGAERIKEIQAQAIARWKGKR